VLEWGKVVPVAPLAGLHEVFIKIAFSQVLFQLGIFVEPVPARPTLPVALRPAGAARFAVNAEPIDTRLSDAIFNAMSLC